MRFLDTTRVRTRFDERVVAADGCELSVDLYLPPDPGRYPVLLTRTAADNNRATVPTPAGRWRRLAAQGYVVAAADVRGRGDSDGKFVPFVHEAADGAATVAWLRSLDESSGKVGVFGSGYGAFCTWAAATADGGVDAVVSVSPFGAVGDGLVHLNGAVRLDWLFWMHLIGGHTLQPANLPPWPAIHRHLPVATMDEALGRGDIWWREWLEHPDPADGYWSALDLADAIAGMNTPGLHITGWWDGQLRAARGYYDSATRSSAPQRLIVGPWDTAGVRHPSATVGGFDFGPRAVLDLDEELTGFFDEHLRGLPSTAPAPVRLFVTGRNEWLDLDTWPPRAEERNLYASSGGAANTRRGDGTLVNSPPVGSGRGDTIRDNPAVPVEFQPMFVSFAAGANPLGLTLDQAHVTARDEALVYTSAPTRETTTIVGRPRADITIRTDAPDADMYLLLSDVFPLGETELHLAHAAVRLATIDAFAPGAPCTVHVEFDDVAHDLLPGHALRLTVTPSLFPLYARNLHGTDYLYETEPRTVDLEVLHDPEAPTSVTFPSPPAFAGA